MGIAILIEQALLGGEKDAFAVDVDRSAFQHDARRETRHLQKKSELPGNSIVGLELLILPPPGIEDPIVEGELGDRLRLLDEIGAVVANS